MFFFDVHTHKESFSENVFSIENKYPNDINFSKPFSIGIHPWFIQPEKIAKELLIIEEKLKDENCFALGECGLDKITATDFELQKIVFRKQIQLSEHYKKPLLIHCVKAFQEIIELKKELKPHQIWILHGFHKNLQVAESLLKNGIMLSFGTAIIHNKKLQEVVSKISISSILLETDNTDVDIKEVYQKIAALKEIMVEDLQQKIKQNFVSLFPRVQSRGFF
ncbi:hydrolase TatD [Polaribacter sp. ALD11]|uniref:TatD family hydrolase n=1 Tax=Polaribacter sp. ALD11 TaxID=2058137 RepID=UPI000C3141C2|nr:TatD family hydrolase [Polaribacter sp. ALD11]AUC86074.1 hydrolase TatD [Polaribacter sp. ALD11]